MWLLKLMAILLIVNGGKCETTTNITKTNCDGLPVKVSTKFGLVCGSYKMSNIGTLIDEFIGLPYAKPPLGKLRFKNPEKCTENCAIQNKWTPNEQKCIQINYAGVISGTEDCLYLNVFRPSKPNYTTKLPVLIFIRGGSFNMGDSNSEDFSAAYLLNQNVILVTFNYRLNFLGFYSTGSDASPGNYGLKDMVAVLRWVKDNIEDFGGNSSSVTLFGNSAGAAAIHHLALSAKLKNEGLFHKIITMSGALAPWAYHMKSKIKSSSIELAKKAGCFNITSNETVKENNETEMEKMVDCMRNKNVTELLNLTRSMTTWKYLPNCIFGPTWEDDKDGAVVLNSPLNNIESGNFHDISSWMIGITKDEGLEFAKFNDADVKYLSEHFHDIGPEVLEYQQVVTNRNNFTNSIINYYFQGNITNNTANFIKLFGDAGVYWPVYQTLQKQMKTTKSKIYVYQFAYEGTLSVMGNKNRPPGVAHMDDMNYLFPFLVGKENQNSTLTDWDRTMIDFMTRLFTTFATTGVPNIKEWAPYSTDKKFMTLGKGNSTEFSMNGNFSKQTMDFWESLMKNVTNGTNEEPPIDKKDKGGNNSASFPQEKSALFTCLLLFVGLYYL